MRQNELLLINKSCEVIKKKNLNHDVIMVSK